MVQRSVVCEVACSPSVMMLRDLLVAHDPRHESEHQSDHGYDRPRRPSP